MWGCCPLSHWGVPSQLLLLLSRQLCLSQSQHSAAALSPQLRRDSWGWHPWVGRAGLDACPAQHRSCQVPPWLGTAGAKGRQSAAPAEPGKPWGLWGMLTPERAGTCPGAMALPPGALQWLLGGFSIKPQPGAAGELETLVLPLSKILLPSACKRSLACAATGTAEHFECPPVLLPHHMGTE